jgi:hypothetical protein
MITAKRVIITKLTTDNERRNFLVISWITELSPFWLSSAILECTER